MGRGLGPTQQTILATLREKARPVSVVELTYHVHFGPDSEDWRGRPPRSAEVSLRRAVDGLERRGAVRRGKERRRDGPELTVLWLPDAEPPERLSTDAPSRWRELDAPLLEILRDTTAGDVEGWFRESYGIRGYGVQHSWRGEDKRRALAMWRRECPPPEDGGGDWVPYQQVVRELLRRQGGRYAPGGFYRGLGRVVARLEAQGLVQVRAARAGWSNRAGVARVRTYHAIRCPAGTQTHQATDTGA